MCMHNRSRGKSNRSCCKGVRVPDVFINFRPPYSGFPRSGGYQHCVEHFGKQLKNGVPLRPET